MLLAKKDVFDSPNISGALNAVLRTAEVAESGNRCHCDPATGTAAMGKTCTVNHGYECESCHLANEWGKDLWVSCGGRDLEGSNCLIVHGLSPMFLPGIFLGCRGWMVELVELLEPLHILKISVSLTSASNK